MKVRDHGYDALMKRLVGRGIANVTIGIHEAEGSAGEGDLTVADVGAIHELGLGDQEERSFVRGYVDENEEQIKADLRKIGQAVVKGTIDSPEKGLEQFGLKHAAGMQKRISDGIEPENKPSTVAKKGSSTPLIDTGVLRASITHKVEK